LVFFGRLFGAFARRWLLAFLAVCRDGGSRGVLVW
jgi:hypothetical protein